MATSTAEFSDFIGKFKSDLTTYTNETQKKERFIMLMTQLFPKKAQQIAQLTKGAEAYTKYLKGTVDNESKYGFIDTLYGQLVIEFEFDLKRTGQHAEQQLREYVAKLWSSQEVKTDFVCISSDGLSWKVFTPKLILEGLTSNEIPSKNIELIPNEPYLLADDHEGFYYWLDRIFFRQNRIAPQSKVICSEFGNASPHFAKTFNGLMTVFNQAKKMKEVNIAVENWRKYLKYTYGNIEASDELFVTHTYLSGFIKLLMANFFSASKKTSFAETQIPLAMTGKFFYDLNVRNYVEKDFFYWINFKEFSKDLGKNWESTFGLLKAYDFSEIGNDFLKDIYQGMVDPKDRHDLGEHYTPDWLCEKIVIESLEKWKEKDLPRIADITCGSGSFLRIAIKLLRKKYYSGKSHNSNKIIKSITKKVIGFEIHPLAAFIAKTNYMLAMEDLLPEAEEPFNIPIYLCDSLLNSELDKMDIEKRTKFAVQLAGKKFELPLIEALSDERFDNLIDYIDDLAHTYKKDELSDNKIKGLLSKKISEFLSEKDSNHSELLDATTGLTKVLHEKVLNHENTIWSFVLKNNFRPIVFNNSIDIVVGNPPWLTFKDVKSEEYRKELEYLGLKQHKVAPANGKLRASMELATIFLAHAVDSYLKKSGNLYFVLPRSLFSADHHSNFREQTYTLDMKIEEIWDLFGVSPLFKVPSCVIAASRNGKTMDRKYSGKIISAKLPEQNLAWAEAEKYLTTKATDLYLVKMGEHTALSVEDISVKSKDNHYVNLFRMGADIFPRNYFYVDVSQNKKVKKVVAVKSCAQIRRNAKKKYKNVDMSGYANTDLLFKNLLAENILPYSARNPFDIHVPVVKNKGEWKILEPNQLLSSGYTDSAKYFIEAMASYKDLSDTGMTLLESLNFHNRFLVQNPEEKYWVLYCSAGKNVCASVYLNKTRFWADKKTYWYCPDTKTEAYYLVGVLNSKYANEIIKPFQSKGLMGERDIEKKILDIGIPRFKKSNKDIAKISRLAEEISKKVEKNISKFTAKSIGKKRNQVRDHFKKEFAEIDTLVVKLFAKSLEKPKKKSKKNSK